MEKTKLERAMKAFVSERRFRMTLFWEGIAVGAITGLVIVAFRFLIEGLEVFWLERYAKVHSGDLGLAVLLLLAFSSIAVVLYKITQKEPMAAGSGIPQIKGILLGKMHMKWASVLVYKFVGGVLAIGSGLSLGREGPSVQLGATIGQGMSRISARSRFEEKFLLTSGAGAGLAAAFNAPLAGVVFCLEELQKNFSPFVLMATISATISATVVSQYFFGDAPIFHLDVLSVLPVRYYSILVIVGIFLGFLGIGFNKALAFSLDLYDKVPLKYGFAKPLIPVLLAAGLGLIFPQILGGGNHLVDSVLTTQYAMGFLLLLFTGKFLFTMICFGSGVPGGIFLPMLVLGALAGSVFGSGVEYLGIVATGYAENFIVFAMAGYFAAVVKSPVTGSILIMEMTGSFQHMLPLICVSMVAYVTADMLNGKPVYDILLERSLKKQQQVKIQMKYKRLLFEVVVENGSDLDGKCIHQISWPQYSLVINIRRGENEISPVGDTRIQAGDYIYIFANERDGAKLSSLGRVGSQ